LFLFPFCSLSFPKPFKLFWSLVWPNSTAACRYTSGCQTFWCFRALLILSSVLVCRVRTAVYRRATFHKLSDVFLFIIVLLVALVRRERTGISRPYHLSPNFLKFLLFRSFSSLLWYGRSVRRHSAVTSRQTLCQPSCFLCIAFLIKSVKSMSVSPGTGVWYGHTLPYESSLSR
jgi:hypothetical protein